MGIWASVGSGNAIKGASGATLVEVDVATAANWNDKVRLALFSDGGEVDAEVELTPDAVRLLRDKLDAASSTDRYNRCGDRSLCACHGCDIAIGHAGDHRSRTGLIWA